MISGANTFDAQSVNPGLVFRIATVPDVSGVRLLHGLPAALADNEVVEFVYQQGRAKADVSNAPDMLALHLHRVVSIACALRNGQGFRLVSLVESGNGEAALIQRFLDLIVEEKVQPLSWRGGEFDLSVLQYRGLLHGLSISVLHDLSDAARLGLAQTLALSSDKISLHELARLCGLPHAKRLPAEQVWHAWRTGRVDEIRARCEVDAVVCHLMLLRCQRSRGLLDAAQYAYELEGVREALAAVDAQPWPEFLADWVA